MNSYIVQDESTADKWAIALNQVIKGVSREHENSNDRRRKRRNGHHDRVQEHHVRYRENGRERSC